MHHPRREPGAVPGGCGRIVPSIIDSLDGYRVRSLDVLSGPLDQAGADSLAPEGLCHVAGVDDPDSPGFNNRRNRFPIVHAADQKPCKFLIRLCNKTESFRLTET